MLELASKAGEGWLSQPQWHYTDSFQSIWREYWQHKVLLLSLGLLGRCGDGSLWPFSRDCFYFFSRKVGNRVMNWDEDRKVLSLFEKIRNIGTNCMGEKYWQIILRIFFFCYRWITWSRIIQRELIHNQIIYRGGGIGVEKP